MFRGGECKYVVLWVWILGWLVYVFWMGYWKGGNEVLMELLV